MVYWGIGSMGGGSLKVGVSISPCIAACFNELQSVRYRTVLVSQYSLCSSINFFCTWEQLFPRPLSRRNLTTFKSHALIDVKMHGNARCLSDDIKVPFNHYCCTLDSPNTLRQAGMYYWYLQHALTRYRCQLHLMSDWCSPNVDMCGHFSCTRHSLKGIHRKSLCPKYWSAEGRLMIWNGGTGGYHHIMSTPSITIWARSPLLSTVVVKRALEIHRMSVSDRLSLHLA